MWGFILILFYNFEGNEKDNNSKPLCMTRLEKTADGAFKQNQ